MMGSEIWQRKHVLMWRIYEQAPFFIRSPMMVPFTIGFLWLLQVLIMVDLFQSTI